MELLAAKEIIEEHRICTKTFQFSLVLYTCRFLKHIVILNTFIHNLVYTFLITIIISFYHHQLQIYSEYTSRRGNKLLHGYSGRLERHKGKEGSSQPTSKVFLIQAKHTGEKLMHPPNLPTWRLEAIKEQMVNHEDI